MNDKNIIHTAVLLAGIVAGVLGFVLIATRPDGSFTGLVLCAVGGFMAGYGAAGISNTRRW